MSSSPSQRRRDCCRPALYDLWAIANARHSFVGDTVHQMQATHPHAVGEMLAFSSHMFPIGPAVPAPARVTGSRG